MTIKQQTTAPTESDLEAEIHQAVAVAFPWIPSSDFKHQIKFSIKFGHTVVKVDGAQTAKVHGRADVIVYANGEPLAVLELKRNGLAITPDDIEQGLSYARMHNPMPPLVMVTSGSDTRFVETYTGEEWAPAARSESELRKVMQAAGQVASANVKRAVETLLGTRSDLWVSAVRQATESSIAGQSGPWEAPEYPFIKGFLISREATQQALSALLKPRRAVIVEGPPLCGKSNVLRELTVATALRDDIAVLFIDSDRGAGDGVFQSIANVLSAKLAWPVSRDEVRNWLRRLSLSEGPALTLAMDSVLPGNDEVRRDIEELCSDTYGDNVRIVLALDDAIVESYIKSSNGRTLSLIGRASTRIRIGPLNNQELYGALKSLWEDHRIGFIPGVTAAAEMRTPWVVRAVCAGVSDEPKHKDESLTAMLPPMLGLNLIEHARERLTESDLRRKMRQVAKAVLSDCVATDRPWSLRLEAIGTYVVRNATVESVLQRGDIDSLISQGVLKPGTHEAGEALLFIRLPELLASEIALLIASELGDKSSSQAGAIARLAQISTSLPLGDIIAAQAIFDAALRGDIGWNFVVALLNSPPQEESLSAGMKFALALPGVGVAEFRVKEDGLAVTLPDGRKHQLPSDQDGMGTLISNIHSWLILSHLALRPFVAQSPDGETLGRLDPDLMLELGTCRVVLRGPQNDPKRNSVLTHSIPRHGNIVCHKAGVIEPITMAIYRFLGENGAQATDWIEEAVSRGSFPLLCRIDIALQQLTESADTAKKGWAGRMIDDVLKPAMQKFPLLH